MKLITHIKQIFWKRRRAKRAEALKRLEDAIEMTRQDGRIDAIRKAWDAYMSETYPVDKNKLRRAV